MARTKTTLALLAVSSLVAGLAGITCSSSTKSTPSGDAAVSGTGTTGTGLGGATVGGSGGATAVGTVADGGGPTSCANNVLQIIFAPMYSAYDGMHNFQIPAVVNGFTGSASAAAVTWSASDPTMVDLATDPTTGGIMITVQNSGTVDIIASAGTLCGTSTLTITAATPDDWAAGNARYNDGVVLRRVPGPGPGGGGPNGGVVVDGGAGDSGTDAALPTQAACTNCHGDTATLLMYKTVAHTPEQTGGFSDDQLQNIFMNGMIPDGGYFDTSIVTYAMWQSFHKWDMTADEAKGIIVYLRSLTPTAQTGTSNFGGRFDGGVMMRGGRDGGMGMRGGPGAGGAGGAGGDTSAAGGAGGGGGATGP